MVLKVFKLSYKIHIFKKYFIHILISYHLNIISSALQNHYNARL